MDHVFAVAGIETPELRASFQLCQRALSGDHAPIALAAGLMPAQTRPYLYAVAAFAARTDHIADEGEATDRARMFEQWRADSLRELREGHSEHALRRAFVHTARMWDLDVAVIEEMLNAFTVDGATPPTFTTFAELRRYLRGVSGTVAELSTPLLEPATDDPVLPQRLMSMLGEVFQLVDIFQDFSIDLPRGRCYLPAADLQRHGLSAEDLWGRGNRRALDELVELQVERARDLLERAVPVVNLVHPSSQPFLQTCVLAVRAFLGEVEHRKSAVLRERIQLPKGMSTQTLTSVLLPPTTTSPTPPRKRAAGLLRRYLTRRRSPRPADITVPNHVAVIMDGNRRWAAARGETPVDGHRSGEWALVRFIESALDVGISHVSVFAFSTENWGRPAAEVDALFELLLTHVRRHVDHFHKLGVRMRWCGRRTSVPPRLRAELEAAENLTAGNRTLSFAFCIDYGGRTEMLAATKAIASDVAAGLVRPDEISEDDLARQFYLPDLPDVDLLIRTSGEQRTSNFLPWHTAYAEILFTDVLWPDFGRRHLMEAISDYAQRQRRFGADQKIPVTIT